MRYKVVIVVLLFFFNSCQNKEKQENICFDEAQKIRVPLSEIAESVNKIELETSEQSILNIRIRDFDIEILDQYYLIKDGGGSRTIKVFDQQGRYVREIGKLGPGPEEFTRTSKPFVVNKEKGEIIIPTNVGIMVYDINNNFIEKGPVIKGFLTDMWYFDDKLYSIITDDRLIRIREMDILLTVYDSKWNMTDSLLVRKYTDYGVLYADSRRFSKHQNMLCFAYSLKIPPQPLTIDTVYTLNNHQLKPVMIVNSSKHRIAPDIILTDRYLFATYSSNVDQGESYLSYLVYDTKTQKSKNTDRGFVDDFYNTGDVTWIGLIPNTDKFFFFRETEFSENIEIEPNPTLYVGTFKK